MKRSTAVVSLLMALVVSPAIAPAQAILPNAPSAGIDRADKVLLIADGAAKIADFYFTSRNMVSITTCVQATAGPLCITDTGTELNPLSRPFVTHGKPAAAAYAAGTWLLDAVVAHQLRKHGHRKLARAVLLFGIVDNGTGAVFSAWQH